MRFIVTVSIPVEAGNRAVKEGVLGKTIQKILGEQKPEASYFTAVNGMRTGILIIQMDDASKIPAIAEPWFLAFNASVEMLPVMLPQDLQKAGDSIASSAKAYAQEYAPV